MTVSERNIMPQPSAGGDLPEFQVVLRGYDRQQVEKFIGELTSRVTAERLRADHMERTLAQAQAEVATARNQPPPSFEHLGSEAARVLEQAGSTANLLVEEARGRGRRIIEDAETQAADLIAEAERRAGELDATARQTLEESADERERVLVEAREEAQRLHERVESEASTAVEQARSAAESIRERATAEQSDLEAATARLRESRDGMLEYLGRMHASLGELLTEAVEGRFRATAEPASEWVDATLVADDTNGADGSEPAAEHEAPAAPAP
jgi:cell division septum initiation protein DivIVA